ncbi:MAG: type IV pilus biogenesis/stability protein PilW [Gammaproteobacteria bacterium]|nr:type IV pilus biogenesis/stability protein PilW [Gammaproteobacteria bacterium]
MKAWIRTPIIIIGIAVALSACSSAAKKAEEEPRHETPSRINTELGLGYLRQGDYRRSMEKLKAALRYDAENPQAHHYIAELHRRLGDNGSAVKHYERAIELAPEDARLRNNYGTFLCEQNQFQQAEVQFLLAIGDPLFGGRMQSYENVGICAAQAGKLKKAEAYLRKALNSNPKLPTALYRMSMINYDKGDYLRARAYLQRYEQVATHNAESLWLGIQVEHQLGDRDVMLKYATELSRRFSESEEWAEYTSKRW